MRLFGPPVNGIHRTGATTGTATDTGVVYAIRNEVGTNFGATHTLMNMFLVFCAKVLDRAEYRIGRRLPQPAERGFLNHVSQAFELFDVSVPSFTLRDARQDLFEKSLPKWCRLRRGKIFTKFSCPIRKEPWEN